MSIIVLMTKEPDMAAELAEFSGLWNLTVRAVEGGFHVAPEYMRAIHGIHVEEGKDGWTFWREADATTWEDFLLMHMTHQIAGKYGALLTYEKTSGSRIVEARPEWFDTFDHYADQVVKNDQGIVRDMKRNWIYTHRNRNVR